VDNLQEFLAHLNGGSTAQSAIVVLVGMVVVWALGAGVAVTVAGLIRATRKGASALSAWWRKPGRLARIEEHLAGLAPPRPAARPVDWCCAACGLHRQLFASDACRCGCAAVVPAGAYGTKGNHVGGNHSC
jgi:hypothetical protein